MRLPIVASLARLPWLAVLTALIVGMSSPDTCEAIDAQGIFLRAGGSVVVVVGYDAYKRPGSFGTGFFALDSHTVVTNLHVINGASSIEVKLPTGTMSKVVEVTRTSKAYDLAILRIEGSGSPLDLATTKPQVGEEILAIGHPKGLERTLSTGVVSGIRKVKNETLLYQITAPISPGSSGGPILNQQGAVLGLATFYVLDGQNLNFAVPASYINQVMGLGDGQGFSLRPQKGLQISKDKSGAIIIMEKKR